MNDAQPTGCLAAILSMFGIRLGGPVVSGSDLPYRIRDDFLSAAELSFYRVLLNAVGDRAVVCPKVNLADLFFVVQPKVDEVQQPADSKPEERKIRSVTRNSHENQTG